jgi:hypothetical protein
MPGPEADHSPPSSAEVKKVWSYTSTLPYALMYIVFIHLTPSLPVSFSPVSLMVDAKVYKP